MVSMLVIMLALMNKFDISVENAAEFSSYIKGGTLTVSLIIIAFTAVKSFALGHRVIVQQEAVVDPLNVVNTSFYLQDGKYYSQNKINNSTSSFEIVAEYDCVVTLNYGVSSETNYDKLIIKKNSTQIDAISGNVSEKSVGIPLSAGDVITITYTKDYSGSSGSDCGWVAIVYEKVNGITVFADKYTTIKTATKAAAPSNVTSVQNTSAIRLDWEATEAVSGFRIYYKSGDIWKICVSATSATFHIFENLKAGAKYTFAIRPYINVDGVVIWGEYAEFTACSKPVNVTSTVSSASKGKITLKWSAVNGAEVYNVYYKSGNGAYKLYKTYSAPQTLTFSGLASGSKYTFAVRAGVNASSGVVYGGYTPVSVTVK